MSLWGAMHAATSGLRVTQAGIDVVAQNVANADSLGYSRRRLEPVQDVAGDRTSGVRVGETTRALDTVAQRQLRLETSGAAYTSLTARFLESLDSLFGTPGGAGSLDGALNGFTTALQGLAADPSSAAQRGGVLDAANVLASRIANVAEGIQSLRTEAEARLDSAVTRANELLNGIAKLNQQVVDSGASSPALLDERDRLVTELSGLMDIQTSPTQTGAVNLSTTGGLSLILGRSVTVLSFDQRGTLGANNLFAADGSRSVGTITARGATGATIDVAANKLIRSGEIKAALEVRDETLVAAQRQMDELAAGVARALSDRQVAGTAVTAGGAAGFDIDLAGLQAGNAVTVEYQDNAVSPPAARRILLVPTLGNAPATINPADTGDPTATVKTVNVGGSFASLVASIGTALGAGFAVTAAGSSTVRILDDGSAAAPDLTSVSAGITATGTAGGTPQVPLFVDGADGRAFTGSFERGSHLTGLAQRLKVNPDVASDRSRLVVYATNPATPQGDTTRPQFMVDALTRSTRTFGGGLGGGALTPADFARQIIDQQGANAEAAKRLDEGQQVALASIESRFAESSAVNVDQEMAQLVALQTAYGANARVMTAVRDMLDMLMRI